MRRTRREKIVGMEFDFRLGERKREEKKVYTQRETFHAQRLPPFLFKFFNGYLTKFVLNVFFNGLRWNNFKITRTRLFYFHRTKIFSSSKRDVNIKSERKKKIKIGMEKICSVQRMVKINFQDSNFQRIRNILIFSVSCKFYKFIRISKCDERQLVIFYTSNFRYFWYLYIFH